MFSNTKSYFNKIVADVKDFKLSTTGKGLSKQELKNLQDKTHLDENEIRKLYEQFRVISNSKDEDLSINKKQFLKALGLQDSVIVDRLFTLMDDDNDGSIDYRQFITGMKVFYEQEAEEEKIKYCFKFYDMDGDGYISKEDLYELFHGSFLEDRDPEITEDQLTSLVDAVFAESDLDGDNKLSSEEFRGLILKSPGMITAMTLGKKKQ